MGIILSFKYSYINAKIRALLSNVIFPENYKKYINMDMSNVLSIYFKFYQFNSFTHHIELKKIIFNEFIKKSKSIIKHTSGNLRYFFDLYSLWLIMPEIKSVIYIIKNPDSNVFKKELINPEFEKIGSYKDIYKHFPILEKFSRFVNVIDKNLSMFEIEKALEIDFFNLLNIRIKKVSNSEKMFLYPLFSFMVDSLNIENITRLYFNFGFSVDDCINYIFPGGLFSKEFYRDMLKENDLKFALKKFSNTRFSFLEKLDSILEVKRVLEYEKVNKAKTFLYKNQFNAGIILAYLWILESEYLFINRLVESKLLKKQGIFIREWDVYYRKDY